MIGRHALLIGNDRYIDSAFPNLKKSVRNVEFLAQALQNPDIGNFKIKTVINQGFDNTRREIAQFYRERERNDLLLIYLTGHGIREGRDNLYFAVKDTESNALDITAISSRFIANQIDKSASKRHIILLDCCYSGAFSQGLQGAKGATVVMLTASDATEFAWEDDKKNDYQNSIFTHYLIDGLVTGEADSNKNGTINIDELYDYLFTKMKDSKQNPLKLFPFGRQEGEIIIAKSKSSRHHFDWGNAPDVSTFFGRTKELATLKEWIIKERCRLVAILGMRGIGKTKLSMRLGKGGIGKTDLSLKLAQGIQDKFEFIIWRSLLNAPPLTDILTDMIKHLSSQKEINLPNNIEDQILKLLYYIKTYRTLIIFDNVEAILQKGKFTGTYLDEYVSYGELIRQIGEVEHKSCLLLTSREKPKEIAMLEGNNKPVRSIELKGLDVINGRKIFETIGSFSASDDDWEELIDFYNGNPLALELSAKHINEVYFGDISSFIEDRNQIFNDLKELLDWHFDRLSYFEKEVLYWMAINREPVSISELKEDILSFQAKKQLPSTLQSLQRRIPIEKVTSKFTIQPVLIEYMTEQIIEQAGNEISIDKTIIAKHITHNLIEKVSQEIITGDFFIFNNFSLVKAFTKEYIRNVQLRLIVNPIINKIKDHYGDIRHVEIRLLSIISKTRNNDLMRNSYAAGNVLNFLCYLKTDLTGYDFSSLKIKQAFLQGVDLHKVNFFQSDFEKSVFTQTFGSILSVAFSPDGKYFASGDANSKVRIWRISDGQVFLTCEGHNTWVRSISFSPDGKIVASGNADQVIRLWSMNDGICLNILKGHTNWIRSVTFNPNNQKMIASTSDDKTVKIWDICNNKCIRTLNGHTDKVWSVSFNPIAQLIASGSDDKTVKIWNVNDGSCINTFRGHTSPFKVALFFISLRYKLISRYVRSILVALSLRSGLLRASGMLAER